MNLSSQLATLGGGCFWCVEAMFLRLNGVLSLKSGYSGGSKPLPTYKEVCSGTTGHAEVCQIAFDPSKLTYEKLLQVFFLVHDPTTLNRQGDDVGTQYRSVIFYHDEEQRKIAEKVKDFITKEGVYKDPIVTEIVALEKFYEAEDYHQNYFALNPKNSYCQVVVKKKVDYFLKKFGEMSKI